MNAPSVASLTGGIERVCRTTSGAVGIERAVAGRLQAAVGFDAWCALTLDPATLLPTGGFHEEGVPPERLPRLVEIEARGDDALALPSLARSRSPVTTLSQATDGRPERSRHYREVLAPSGLGHEMRVLFGTAGAVWGALVLFRETGAPDFSPGQVELVAASTGGVAAAIRRELVLDEVAQGGDADGPGLLLLDATLTPVSVTSGAQRWLAEIDDDVDARTGLPHALMIVGHRATAATSGPARGRLRTRAGRWLSVHAERLMPDSAQVSLIIEPSRPIEIAELVADAYSLTARERHIVRLLAGARSRSEMARDLGLSPHTVDDHIKRVYAKLDVRSRAELSAKLFFDQHAPRIVDAVPVGGTGWFLR